jgi:Flp pilus assembly pilin Flp
MGVEPVRLRGREDGGSAVEAALLMAAMTLVLLPILYALGRTTDSAIEGQCDTLAEKVGYANCAEGGSGGGGGGSGSGGGGGSASAVEADVTRYWSTRPSAAPATSVDCVGFDESPPPVGATTECTVTTEDGPAQVRVTVIEGGGYDYQQV